MAVAADTSQRFEENPGGKVFSITGASHPKVDIVINTFYITLVQLTKRITVTLRGAGKNFLFIEFNIRQVKNLTGGFGLNNTAGFNKLH